MNKESRLFPAHRYFLFMDEKVEFCNRLKEAVISAGYPYRPIVIEREFNTRYWGRPISVQAVRRWMNGEAIPSQDKLQVIAEWLQIEPHVLRFGGKSMLNATAKKKQWDAALTGPEKEVLLAYLNLPAPERKTVREVILAFKKSTES